MPVNSISHRCQREANRFQRLQKEIVLPILRLPNLFQPSELTENALLLKVTSVAFIAAFKGIYADSVAQLAAYDTFTYAFYTLQVSIMITIIIKKYNQSIILCSAHTKSPQPWSCLINPLRKQIAHNHDKTR